MRNHHPALLLMFSLHLTRVLTGSEAALEPEQFLRMMAEMSERVEERRADHGIVGHYNSALCSTTYEEVCTTLYSQECNNQVRQDSSRLPRRQIKLTSLSLYCRPCLVFPATEKSVPLERRNGVRQCTPVCAGQRRRKCVT